MKYPKAKKLPSGRWHCRVRVQGRDVSITCQTKDEAVAEAMAIKAGIKEFDLQEASRRKRFTVGQAVDAYISARENVLSPATLRGYRAIQKNRFRRYKNLRINDISAEKWQRIVNEESRLCSAKTLKNAWYFMASVINETTTRRISVRLPQVVSKDEPFLTPEQIPTFVLALRGQSFEIGALLALSGLRRSEILALCWKDINLQKGTIRIAGSAVIGEDNKLKQKETNKNLTSNRTIPIIPPLEEALRRTPHPQTGLVVRTAPNTLYCQINRLCGQLGLPKVGVHGLRRSFASLAYHLNLSEEVTMRIGGWSDIFTMRKIYTKISEKDINEQTARLQAFFCSPNERSDNENANGKT